MLKKFVGLSVFLLLLAFVAAPVLAQSCGHRGHGNGWHKSNRYANNYDRGDRYDRGRRSYNRGGYDRGYGRSYGRSRNRVVYVPSYTPVYYGPSYRVRRAPVRRYYSNNGYYNNRPRYRNNRSRGYISVSLGF